MLRTILGVDLCQTDTQGSGIDEWSVSLHEEAPGVVVAIPDSGPDFCYVLSHLPTYVELGVRFLIVIKL